MVERTLRAANHCRWALLAGYTTYRDLGAESMRDSDANLRDAIARGITPGPRLFVATQALASTGTYDIRTENGHGDDCPPPLSDAADGVDGVRSAVRRRIAVGADIIKFYADYRRRVMRYPPTQLYPYVSGLLHPPREPNPDIGAFSQEEMDMIVREAKMAKCPVAAHCMTLDGALGAVKAGATTLEHVTTVSDDLFRAMIEKKVIMVPTLGVMEKFHAENLPRLLAQTKRAHDLGVRFACGGDTGPFNHGQNAREMELMMQAGFSVEDVLEACTVGGWEACGGDLCGRRFGWIEEGFQADIVALQTDPRLDKNALRKVDFVMKDARIWKLNSEAIGMV
jgi:imidazolonepropionase-like amidohydrolase